MGEVAASLLLNQSHPTENCDSLFSDAESSVTDGSGAAKRRKHDPTHSLFSEAESESSADGSPDASDDDEDISPPSPVQRRKSSLTHSLFSEADSDSSADGSPDESNGDEDISPPSPAQRRKSSLTHSLFSGADDSEWSADRSPDASDDGEDISPQSPVERRKNKPAPSLFTEADSESSSDGSPGANDGGRKNLGRHVRGYMIREAPRPVIFRHGERTCVDAYHTEPHPPGGLFSFPNNSCPILSDLRMIFTPYGFACHIHATLIPPALFERHMEKHITRAVIRKDVVAHLLSSHRITAETDCPEPAGDLTEPIPGLKVQKAFKCPVTGCPGWYTTRNSLRSHYVPDHSLPKLPPSQFLMERFISRPYYNIVARGDSLARWVFPFDAQWAPDPSPAHQLPKAIYHHSKTAAPTAAFLIELGWLQYMSKFNQSSRSLLFQLVQIHPPAEVNALSGNTKRLENGILLLRKLFVRYLIDLQRYRYDTNSEVVQVLLRQ